MKVLIVDDDALVTQSLATILSVEPDVEVVGRGGSGPEAVEKHRELSPDILLLDIRMPGGDGLGAAEQILAEDEDARIVFLTTFSDDEYIVRALRMGARGYLIKQDVARIAPALRSVMAGVSVLEGRWSNAAPPWGWAVVDPQAGAGRCPGAPSSRASPSGSTRSSRRCPRGWTMLKWRTGSS